MTDLSPKQRTFYKDNYAPKSGEIMYSDLFVETMNDYAISRKKILERRKEVFQDISPDGDSEAYINDNLEKLDTVSKSLQELRNEIKSYNNKNLTYE